MTASRKTHVKVEISLNVFKRGESCGKASDCCTLITDVPAGTMRDVSLLLGTYLLVNITNNPSMARFRPLRLPDECRVSRAGLSGQLEVA